MAPLSASEKVRPKKSYFSSACEYVKLPFSLRVPKRNVYFKFYQENLFLLCLYSVTPIRLNEIEMMLV
jgi:hypothetical protein